MTRIIISSFLALALPAGIFSVDFEVRSKGVVNLPGLSEYAVDVAISGNYAYVAALGHGLFVLDVANPAQPRQIAKMEGWVACETDISGDIAYVAAGREGLKVIDITNPANPQQVATSDTEGNARRLAVSGNYVFVTEQRGVVHFTGSALMIFDITNPATPVRVAEVPIREPAEGVTVSGNYAYVAGGSGVEVISISNPVNPIRVGRCDTGVTEGIGENETFDVTVSGNYAYVAARLGGLQVFDLTNPVRPKRVGTCKDIFPRAVTLSGNYAYLTAADGAITDSGLRIVDISNPANPQLVATYGIGDDQVTFLPRGLAVSGNHAFVTGGSGLQVIDVSNKSNLQRVGGYLTSQPFDVSVSDNYAFVAAGWSGLEIIDLNTSGNPQRVGGCYLGNIAHRVVASGKVALVLAGSTLHLIDTSNATHPRLAWSFDYGNNGGASDLAISGTNAFITEVLVDSITGQPIGRLAVLDITNPDMPQRTGAYLTTGSFDNLEITGKWAYVVKHVFGDSTSTPASAIFGQSASPSFSTLMAIDVSDPHNPRLASEYPGEIYQAALSG